MANELLKLDKTFDSLMDATMQELANTPINHTSPGSVARMLLARMNAQLATFYDKLEIEVMKPLLSKSTGASLDMVGKLLNCTRYADESDESYKYRISHQTLTLEKANETAIRLAALSVYEVKDVILKEFSHGTGSFSVYPIVDNPKFIMPDTINSLNEKMNEVRALGVRATVLLPRLVEVEIRARILYDDRAPSLNRQLGGAQATDLIRTHIAKTRPGGTISPDYLKKEIMKMDGNILNVEIYHFRINNRPMVVMDQTAAWNEQFVEADMVQAILVS